MKLAAHMSILTGLPSIAKRGIVDPFENPNRATTLIASLERSWPMVHHCVAFSRKPTRASWSCLIPAPRCCPTSTHIAAPPPPLPAAASRRTQVGLPEFHTPAPENR